MAFFVFMSKIYQMSELSQVEQKEFDEYTLETQIAKTQSFSQCMSTFLSR